MKPIAILQALVVGLLCAISQFAVAQLLTPEDSAKTTPQVIENALKGVPQTLAVILESQEIVARERTKRHSRGLQFNDQQLADETAQEFDQLKESVFPGGRLGGAQVVGSHKHVAILSVQISDWASMTRVLKHPKVKSVQPRVDFKPALVQSLPMIGQPAAAAAGKRGAGNRITILDSGISLGYSFWTTNSAGGCKIRTTDPLYAGPSGWPYIGEANCRISSALDFYYANPYATPNPYLNVWDHGNGHGTNVSAIALAVAPEAKIDSHNVFNATTGMTEWEATRRGLDWVLSNFNKGTGGRIVAVNMSFASTTQYSSECPLSLYAEYFSRLRDSGILPVVASGNNGFSAGVGEPACAPGAVRVGMVYDADVISSMPWSWSGGGCTDSAPTVDTVPCASNSSSLVTLLAPGAFITAPPGASGMGGTSQAAPHVAGAIAVLRQAFPTDTLEDTVLRMTSSGKSVVDRKNNVSKPRLNLSAALATPLVASATSFSKVLIAAVFPILLR